MDEAPEIGNLPPGEVRIFVEMESSFLGKSVYHSGGFQMEKNKEGF
jgi:hypothetical protein